MTLYLYFARRFAMIFLGMLGIFALLYAMLDMIEILRKFDTNNVGMIEILTLTALNVPGGLNKILPLIIILATLSMFLGLARSSELVVVRAAGRSALRSLASPVLVAMLIGVVSVAIFNPIVAATSKQYEALSNNYRNGTSSVLSISPEGLWLRQATQSGQTVIRAGRANLDGTELFNVTFLAFGKNGLPSSRIEAESATLIPGAWVALAAKEWQFQNVANPEKRAQTFDELRIETNLTRDAIRNGFGTPASIPIWELPGFINKLELAGFSARRHRVWFQTELAKPLLLAAMVMIAAGFTMRHTRFGRTGLMVLLAILLGFLIYFIRNFAVILGENGQIPVLLAAWAPPVAAIFLSLGLVLHMEDG